MLDFAFDAKVIIEFQGNRNLVSLSLALVVASKLLANDVVFSIESEQQGVYCTYDGEKLYADTRVTAVLQELGISLTEN